jgi:hypothetical protein
MKLIICYSGESIMVSDIDYEFLNQYRWYYSKPTTRKKGYIIRNVGEGKVKGVSRDVVHRMGLNYEIDHIDRNTFNNQRGNLREATRRQNSINSGIRSNNTSGYKGVCFHQKRNKWRANTMMNNKQYFIGYYDTAKEAAKAYNETVERLYGEFAYLNIIED